MAGRAARLGADGSQARALWGAAFGAIPKSLMRRAAAAFSAQG